MTVLSLDRDTEALTMTFVTQFDADVERVWQIWADPRQLERWWGPPSYPATFERHDLVPGGESRYFMTGPEGDKARGWFRITAVDAPSRLELDDGFSGEDGEPDPSMEPGHIVVTLEPADGGTRMTIKNSFASAEQLEQMIAMGMEEGMREALGQVDELLLADAR
jgi:uncharacterized protein YndB with AHSA1/START domain